jgi:hypothetical protein
VCGFAQDPLWVLAFHPVGWYADWVSAKVQHFINMTKRFSIINHFPLIL